MEQNENIKMVYGEISSEFVNELKGINEVIIIGTIGKTDSKIYKQIKEALNRLDKKILKEVLE